MVTGDCWPRTSVLEKEDRGRAPGVVDPGVQRPDVVDGVTRPLANEGVIRPEGAATAERGLRPVGMPSVEGVILSEFDKGVMRPLREEATEDGRETLGPAVAADSFEAATNTPQFGGQKKHCMLEQKRQLD